MDQTDEVVRRLELPTRNAVVNRAAVKRAVVNRVAQLRGTDPLRVDTRIP